MQRTRHLFATGACLILACGLALGTGCTTEPVQEQAAADSATIQIRFHESTEAQPQTFGLLAGLAPIEYTDVSRILVDVTYADDGQPFALNFDLTPKPPNVWEGTLPFLPSNQQLRFAAEAFDANGTVIFSGETLATLTIDNQGVEIPLAPAQDQQTFDMPRMYRIVYPTKVVDSQEVQVIFTIEGNPGETIDYTITSADGSSPFSPAAGTVTLTNTVADFITLYTAPEVSEETAFTHEVTITSADSLSSVAIATSFTTTVTTRIAGIDVVDNVLPSVLFNPVIKELEANGTAIPNAVQLTADVSDDGDPALRTHQWSYTPNTGTAAATFLDATTNPAILQDYTVDHQGTITLEVTDENGGTTTLYYELVPNQFADAIDHAAANGLAQIVAGDAHTCVRTGEGKVRCWGEAQTGQLGYGNALDIGDALDRLPYTAGDVPLPTTADGQAADPVAQLVAGDNHTCALLQSGMIYCWGSNTYGQLGYNTTDDLGDGEPVISFGYVSLGGPAAKIAAGGDHTCAILKDSGALRCWGRNDYGQLGRGHTDQIGDDENVFDAGNVNLGTVTVEHIALGDQHTCALLTTGNIRCWGRNDSGQLGYGRADHLGDDETIEALADVALPGPVRKVVAGPAHTCALMENGAARCWGHGQDGRTGYGFRSASNPSYGDQSGETPIDLTDLAVGASITDITAGDAHTCALLSDSQLACWGNGQAGRLGYGTQDSEGTPPASGVDLQGTSAYRIAAGAAHTCALRSNGTARCWGEGSSGRLGQGGIGDIYSPAAARDIAIFEPVTLSFAKSCSEIRSTVSYTSNGTYYIDVDGASGTAPFEVYCEMFADGGGWTLVSTIANDGNTYWTWNNRAFLYNGNVYGTITEPLVEDYQSPAWTLIAGDSVLVEANGSRTKYARYDAILSSQPLSAKYPSTVQTVGDFHANAVSGSWFQECGSSLSMRLMTPDSDGNGWSHASVGFVWRSSTNNGCYWDDAAGGISNSYYPGSEMWGSSHWQFYNSNFSTALNVFVR